MTATLSVQGWGGDEGGCGCGDTGGLQNQRDIFHHLSKRLFTIIGFDQQSPLIPMICAIFFARCK